MDLMDWQYDRTFRFLDLPPELRNEIYKFYLSDPNIEHHQLEISHWKSFAPDPSITAVSTQIRSESIGYFHSAFTDFFKNHGWYLELTTSMKADPIRSQILSTLHSLPKAAMIRELQFSIPSLQCSCGRGRGNPVVISVHIDPASEVDKGPGKPEWAFRVLNNAHQPHRLAIVLLQMWVDRFEARARDFGVSLTNGYSADLNVENCARVVLGKLFPGDKSFDGLAKLFVA